MLMDKMGRMSHPPGNKPIPTQGMLEDDFPLTIVG